MQASPTIPDLEERLRTAVEWLVQAVRPTRIILFGSRARGTADPRSDIDLLVVMENCPDRVQEMVRIGRILQPLLLPIDLLVVSQETFDDWCTTPGNVYFAAASEGRLLYDHAA